MAEPEFGFSRDLFSDQRFVQQSDLLCQKHSTLLYLCHFMRLFFCASGFLSVPLNLLWSHCPKVGALSGTLENLRHLLSDEPSVKFSQDGDAVLIQLQEEGTVVFKLFHISLTHMYDM